MERADLPPEVVQFYENAFKEMMETEEWKAQRDNYGWLDNFMPSAEFKEFLDREYKIIGDLMLEIGLGQ